MTVRVLEPELVRFICTEGHVTVTVAHNSPIRWCSHRIYQDVTCNERCRPLTEAENAAYLIGGQEALAHTVKKCQRCGLGQGAWCHSSGAAHHEWHAFEWDRESGTV